MTITTSKTWRDIFGDPVSMNGHVVEIGEGRWLVAHYDDDWARWICYCHHHDGGYLTAADPEHLIAPRVYRSRKAAVQAAAATYGLEYA